MREAGTRMEIAFNVIERSTSMRDIFGARPRPIVSRDIRELAEPGGLLGKQKQQRVAYAGTPYAVTRGYDGGRLMTACHYESPLGTFTITGPGRIECPPVAVPPSGHGGR